MDWGTALILVSIGLAAGMLSGFVGIGGGVVMVPALIYFLSMNQLEAQGTSLAVMLPPIGILAYYQYHNSLNLDIRNAGVIAAAFIIGGYFGSKLAIKININAVRLSFGIFMLLIAIRMIYAAIIHMKDHAA